MWFLDTGYLIALFSEKDAFHAQAIAMQVRAQNERVRLITTDAVIFEVGAAFSKVAMRVVGARIMDALLADENVEVVAVSQPLRSNAITLFTKH